MTIIEKDIDLYTASIENAQRRLRTCHPVDEQYWRDLAMRYAIVANALKDVDTFIKNANNEITAIMLEHLENKI